MISNLAVSWRTASRHPGVVRFLVGRFFYTDAINTLIGGFLVVFAQQEIGFDAGQVQALTIIGIASAIVGGLVAGWLVDRAGPRIILHGVLAVWIATMAIGIAAAAANLEDLGWVVGVAGGLALGPPGRPTALYGPAHTGAPLRRVLRALRHCRPLRHHPRPAVVGAGGRRPRMGRLAALGLLAVNVLIARIVLQGVPRLPARAGTAAATVGQSG